MSSIAALQAQVDVLAQAVAALFEALPADVRGAARNSLHDAVFSAERLSDVEDAAQARVLRRLLGGGN